MSINLHSTPFSILNQVSPSWNAVQARYNATLRAVMRSPLPASEKMARLEWAMSPTDNGEKARRLAQVAADAQRFAAEEK